MKTEPKPSDRELLAGLVERVTYRWLGRAEAARAFKGVIYDDISEFKSYPASHAIGLCRCGPCLPISIIGKRLREAFIYAVATR